MTLLLRHVSAVYILDVAANITFARIEVFINIWNWYVALAKVSKEFKFCEFMLNFMALGKLGCDTKLVIAKLISRVYILRISCETVLRWMLQYLIECQSTLIQAMAYCHQATRHYLNQSWPRSMSPYVSLSHNELTRPLEVMFVKSVPGNGITILTKFKYLVP